MRTLTSERVLGDKKPRVVYGAAIVDAPTRAQMVIRKLPTRLLGRLCKIAAALPVAALILAAPTPPALASQQGHAAAVANPFGAEMFGIATGGSLADESSAQLSSDLAIDHHAGAKWLRIEINWASIQAGGPSSFDWAPTDAVVRGAEALGMKVLGVIVYTPSWARPAGTAATYAPAPSAYAAFAAAAATHYAALGVQAYEVWNEENNVASWTPSPSPSSYTAVLKAAYAAIHGSDSGATVVAGGFSPAVTDGTDYAPTDFLAAMYADGAHGSFDALGVNPYCWPADPGDAVSWSAWYQTYGTPVNLRSLMVSHGDGSKLIWGTEFGAPTAGPPGGFVTEAQQAQMIMLAYQLWSSYSWAGPLFVYEGRDAGTDTSSVYDNFGLTTYAGSPKPAYFAYELVAATL